MNTQLINKLLLAIRQQGREVKIESKMIYSDNSHKYITKYILYELQPGENRKNELVMKWVEIYSGYGKAKLITYLSYYYKLKEGEANGKANRKTEKIH